MTTYDAVPALAEARRNTLLAEANASRLAAQARSGRHTATAGKRRSPSRWVHVTLPRAHR
ncbi:MAG: hypothetical protein M3Y44_09940 [Actinomycetota bacterium]|nr:hypothetical protein [Actinomycetota bacterium]